MEESKVSSQVVSTMMNLVNLCEHIHNMCTILGPNALTVFFFWFVKFDRTNNFSLKIHPNPISKLLHLLISY